VSSGTALRAFYRLKPLIPRPVQVGLRRVRARRIWDGLGHDCRPPIPSDPLGYPWPDGHRAAAIITHDVELEGGQRNVGALAEIEAELGIRSCWNFVVRRYPVDTALIARLRADGHEVGVHGVHHDGHLFDSREIFVQRLEVMRDAARRWGADGFRSPSLLYDRHLLAELPFGWDSSMPAWDPFQPQPGGCRRFTPFALNERCIELPVTLWQDFILLEELRMTDVGVWRTQVEFLHAIGGLINVIVHPDYIATPARLALYRELLQCITARPRTWIALPSEVADWERRRHAVS